MISDRELLQVIAECENGKPSLANCEKLATFYTIYDHRNPPDCEGKTNETSVLIESDSEVARLLNGMDTKKAWSAVMELIEAVQVLNPKLFRSFMEKLAE